MQRRLYVVAACLALVAGAALMLRHPGADVVCSRTVALHRGLPTVAADSEALAQCREVLAIQASRETPWGFAAQMRCYADASSPASFHDCGGELCHFAE